MMTTSAHESPNAHMTARHMGRYERQMVLPEVGIDGQRRLLNSRVLVVGAGALGSAASMYLATAGVGTIGLVDGDTVDLSNLHRQILHDDREIGQLKAESGARRLLAMNPDVRVEVHPEFLTSQNVLRVFAPYDLIINGSDNFPARYLVNDAAVILKKPLVDAAILRFEGQLAVYAPGKGCYRCLFPTPPSPGSVPDCAEAGILGPVAGVLGSMQAVEALKVLLGLASTSGSQLLVYNALGATWQKMPFQRDPNCVVCGDAPSVVAPIDYDHFCGLGSSDKGAAAHGASGVEGSGEFDLSVKQVVDRMDCGGFIILDIRPHPQYLDGHMAGALHFSMEYLDRLTMAQRLNAPILVVCEVGVRSVQAAQYLRSHDLEAWSMAGGMRAWSAAGKQVVP